MSEKEPKAKQVTGDEASEEEHAPAAKKAEKKAKVAKEAAVEPQPSADVKKGKKSPPHQVSQTVIPME